MQVSAYLVDEEVEDWALSVLNTVRSSLRSNFTDDTVNFILSEKFWNVAGRNDIVYINEEVILYNLRVRQNEHRGLANNTSLRVSSLDINFQIGLAVVRGDDNAEDILTEDVSSQLR